MVVRVRVRVSGVYERGVECSGCGRVTVCWEAAKVTDTVTVAGLWLCHRCLFSGSG